MVTFSDLGLGPNLLKALSEAGYETPTEIQEKAIPQILMSKDVVGLAQTGTGKTAGFTLPMLEILGDGRARARMPRSLILAPTRELAAQIAESFDKYGKYQNLTKALLVGGVSMGDQVKNLEHGVDVLIATPGRFLDLFERGGILLTDIKTFVIDEADRMLDMGFIPDIERIVKLLPAFRQTLLFSATMQPEIQKLTEKFMMAPKTVAVSAPSSTAKTVKQNLIWLSSPRQKNSVLYKIIDGSEVENGFIFCNRKKDIAGLAKFLKSKGLNVDGLHGDMTQPKRTEVLGKFKAGELDIMVCSDVAARGLDIKGVSHVFNFDVPSNAEDYVHRIGRTGRAGKSGEAYTLAVSGGDDKAVAAIEKLTKKPIPVSNDFSPSNDQEEQKKTAPKRSETPKPKAPNKQSRRKSVDEGDSDLPSVVGFGDDIPDFMR